MKVHFEFMTQFREKTGTDRCTVFLRTDQGKNRCTLIQALKELENRFADKGLKVQEHGRLLKGVILFIKETAGGLSRIEKPEDHQIEENQTFALAAAMAGG
jgi:hypothetical protein